MKIIEFIKDRAFFILLLLSYEVVRVNYGDALWNSLLQRFTDFQLVLFGTAIISVLCYFVSSGLLAIVDLFIMPDEVAMDKRVQPKKEPNWSFYAKAIPVVMFNLTFLGVPFGYIIFYFLHKSSPYNNLLKNRFYPTLPSSFEVVWQVAFCVLCEEILFYYSHRLFHIPFLYTLFHKKHHEFTAPIGISAVYTTPVDFIVSNLSPLLVGPLILQSHPVVVWAYFVVAIINTVVTHGGYKLPGFPDARLHDFHHETFNNMYGVIGLLDNLHGTDDKFRARYYTNVKSD